MVAVPTGSVAALLLPASTNDANTTPAGGALPSTALVVPEVNHLALHF